jgi:Na+-translocating ferredoxin:NAD+ oxidoreductase subunit A
LDIGVVFTILLSNILIYNFIFSRFIGLCPYMGCTKEMSTAIGMGLSVIFVMTLAAFATWPVYNYLLAPTASNIWAKIFHGDPANFDLTRVLRTITFILVIAGLVQFVEMFLMKVSPPLYRALGIYLPLITTNCAVLGVSVLNIDMFFAEGKPVELSFAKSVLQGFGGGIGFMLAMILMASVRERLELSDIPKPLRGMPIAFLVATIIALAFLGFTGMIK